jgi:hypothetical protein
MTLQNYGLERAAACISPRLVRLALFSRSRDSQRSSLALTTNKMKPESWVELRLERERERGKTDAEAEAETHQSPKKPLPLDLQYRICFCPFYFSAVASASPFPFSLIERQSLQSTAQT